MPRRGSTTFRLTRPIPIIREDEYRRTSFQIDLREINGWYRPMRDVEEALLRGGQLLEGLRPAEMYFSFHGHITLACTRWSCVWRIDYGGRIITVKKADAASAEGLEVHPWPHREDGLLHGTWYGQDAYVNTTCEAPWSGAGGL